MAAAYRFIFCIMAKNGRSRCNKASPTVCLSALMRLNAKRCPLVRCIRAIYWLLSDCPLMEMVAEGWLSAILIRTWWNQVNHVPILLAVHFIETLGPTARKTSPPGFWIKFKNQLHVSTHVIFHMFDAFSAKSRRFGTFFLHLVSYSRSSHSQEDASASLHDFPSKALARRASIIRFEQEKSSQLA